MSLEDLQATPEYQVLTQKQKLFVATYCEFGLSDGNYDAVEATRIAYVCKTREVARVMSYSLMQNIRIVAALNRHFQTEPIEEFMVQLNRAINNKKITPSMVQALRLKCDMLGLGSRIPYENHATGTIPQSVLDAEKAARKPKKKSVIERAPTPEAPPRYGF
jgi:hypothetical protein